MYLLSSTFTAHLLIVLPFAGVSLSRCHFGWMLHLNFSFFWFSLCASDQIYFKKKKTGGISFNSTLPLTHVDEKLCYQILHEYKIHNAEVLALSLHLFPREICMVYVHAALHFCLKYYVGFSSVFFTFQIALRYRIIQFCRARSCTSCNLLDMTHVLGMKICNIYIYSCDQFWSLFLLSKLTSAQLKEIRVSSSVYSIF